MCVCGVRQVQGAAEGVAELVVQRHRRGGRGPPRTARRRTGPRRAPRGRRRRRPPRAARRPAPGRPPRPSARRSGWRRGRRAPRPRARWRSCRWLPTSAPAGSASSRGRRATLRGRTRGSRPVRFWPPSVSPHTGVISEPAYVVGTAMTGRPCSSAIALPSPTADPPPTATQPSAPSSRGEVPGPGGDLDRNVHAGFGEDPGGAVAEGLGDQLPGVLLLRGAQHQHPGEPQAGDLLGQRGQRPAPKRTRMGSAW